MLMSCTPHFLMEIHTLDRSMQHNFPRTVWACVITEPIEKTITNVLFPYRFILHFDKILNEWILNVIKEIHQSNLRSRWSQSIPLIVIGCYWTCWSCSGAPCSLHIVIVVMYSHHFDTLNLNLDNNNSMKRKKINK